MEQAVATVGIWLAVGMVGQKDGLAAIVIAFFAAFATGVIWR